MNKDSKMGVFEVINYSQYSKSCERLGPCDTLQDAMNYCKHQTPHSADAQIWEQYSEVNEVDENNEVVETYFFVTI